MEKQWKICILTTVLAYEKQIIRAKDIVHLMKQIRAMDMDVLFEKFYAQKKRTKQTKSTEMTYSTIFSVCFEFYIFRRLWQTENLFAYRYIYSWK